MQHRLSIAIFALFLVTAGAAMAAGSASVGTGSVDFSADGDGVVTVSGPDGFYARQELKGGHASMSLYDDAGNPLADGTYTWEITVNGVAPADRSERPVQGESFSGAFTLAGGAAANPLALESRKDQVFVDDLIVEGSTCTGFDCTNGENFGADTLRLKENNLRIHFDDTSNSGSFPSNDWRFVANDTTNGGASYMAIEDSTAGRTPFKIENNVPNNALYVDSTGTYGRIGFGTNSPAVDLHVKEGNTPTLRLEQDGSSGFTAQTFDVAGNEANFFIRDVTNGSKLFFRAQPGVPENSIYIKSPNGDVGLGTASPDAELDVEADTPAIRLTGTSSSHTWDLNMNGSGRLNWVLDGSTTNTTVMRIDPGTSSNLLNVGFSSGVGNVTDANTVAIEGNLVLSAASSCLELQDSSGGGTTHCTALSGALVCSTGACP
jgi:hypothetical protein